LLRRYLLTDGQLGEIPEWYPYVRAARYLRVPLWDLLERPLVYTQIAMIAEGAENEAQDARMAQQ